MTSLITEISAQRSQELRDYAASRRQATRARRRRSRSASSATVAEGATIRVLDPVTDRKALYRLAGRDSAAVPTGKVLVAEFDGRLVAALSLDTGALIADPFTATGEVVARLQARAAQLSHGERGRTARRHGFHLTLRPRRS